jgi:hypothetical protein
MTLKPHALNQEKQPGLSNRHTNWDDFRHVINERLTLNVSLKTEEGNEAAVMFFSDTIQGAAEQIKRFGGVNTRAVVGVGWCTWSPSVLSVTPFQ